MGSIRRVAVIASASGNGKTTLARELAERMGVPFVELDALVHGPGWTETPDDVLADRLAPTLAADAWVIDGTYRSKLGDRVLEAADVVVWLDLPIHVWLPRLMRRTGRRLAGREQIWNGNRESLRAALWGRDSLFGYALQSHFARRREWPAELRAFPVVRLRTTAGVRAFVTGIGYWLVEHEARDVGVAGITAITLGDMDCWNLYYRFSPEVQGRGLAAEATREAIAVARELTPEWPVVARTRPDNAPAIRLALAIGLVRCPDLDGAGFVAFVG